MTLSVGMSGLYLLLFFPPMVVHGELIMIVGKFNELYGIC